MASVFEPEKSPASRRAFLQQALGLYSVALLPGWALADGGMPVPGWAIRPRSVGDLTRALQSGPSALRPRGAGLSLSGLSDTPGTQLNLQDWSGAVSWNEERQRMRFRAGTSMAAVAEQLETIGLAMPVMGDSPKVTLAGAVSTSSHGGRFGSSSFSGHITAAQLVSVEGEVLEISERDNAALLPAVSCGLGVLGVLTELEVAAEPSERLREEVNLVDWRDALSALEDDFRGHRHAEIYIFPQVRQAVQKRWTPTAQLSSAFEESEWRRKLREILVQLGHEVPPLDGWAQQFMVWLAHQSPRSAPSHRMLQRPDGPRFAAMEYALPFERAAAAAEELRNTLRRTDQPLVLPLRLRPVAEDVSWISPFYRQPSVCMEVRCKSGAQGEGLLRQIEPVLKKHGGRPHWGMLHELSRKEAASLYPRWEEFRDLRRRLDPQGRLLNQRLQTLFA